MVEIELEWLKASVEYPTVGHVSLSGTSNDVGSTRRQRCVIPSLHSKKMNTKLYEEFKPTNDDVVKSDCVYWLHRVEGAYESSQAHDCLCGAHHDTDSIACTDKFYDNGHP